MKIRLATNEIQRDSIVDGEGIRSVIWTQGCIHNCKGCHNPETHSFQEGIFVEVDLIKEKINSLEGQDGITFSGGDPMEQPVACAEIAKHSKKLGLNIWCYTGYTFEELLAKSKHIPAIKDFLNNIDVLVDGPFIISKFNPNLKWRGSANQRVIDVQASLASDTVVLHPDCNTVDEFYPEKAYDPCADMTPEEIKAKYLDIYE